MANKMKQLTTAAKKIRARHPKMTWQNAIKAAAKGGGTKRRISGTRAMAAPTAMVGRRRKSSGGRGDGSIIGAVSLKNPMALGLKIVKLAGSMAAGVVVTEMVVKPYILRPLEGMIAKNFPQVQRFTPIIEILAGSIIVLTQRNQYVKAMGLGMVGVGVANGIQRSGILRGIGYADYSELTVPVNGTNAELSQSGYVAGVLKYDQDVITKSDTVAGGNFATLSNSDYVAGEEIDQILDVKYAM
jgi:hypothetical protein